MLKRIVLFFSILCAGLILNSCSESLDRTSSVSFKLSDSFFREALNSGSISISDSASAAKGYVVKVSVSWDKGNRFEYDKVSFDDEGNIVCPEFTFEDLPAGKTVKIDVSISCGGTVIYNMKPVEKELKAGANECQVTLEKQVADVAISIANKDSLNLDSSYKLLVEITDSSNKTAKSEYPIDETNIYTIAQDKTIGETLKIEVSVYNNSLCLYKTLEPVSATVDKENIINVTLSNAVSTAAVWQNKMSSGNNAVFYQNKNFNAMQESDCFNGAVPGIYAFDNSGNLWIHSSSAFDDANKQTFTIYPLDSNELIYKNENTNNFAITLQSESTIKDIYFDSGFLYVLTEKKSSESGDYNYYVTKYNTETKEYNEKLVSFDSGSASLSMLAVHNDMVVVSSGTGIFYIENLLISTTFKEFPVDFVNLLTGMNIELTENVSITDLQFGDGLGNDTDKLYVLVRNCSSSISNTDSDSTYYSSGALVEIDVENLESNYKLYGNAAENNTVQITAAGTNKDVVFVSPVDDSNFFGPYKFVALAPRKLVILDDGVSVDTDNKKLTNNDALFEFDIAEKTITKGESVSASVPYVSGFAKDW